MVQKYSPFSYKFKNKIALCLCCVLSHCLRLTVLTSARRGNVAEAFPTVLVCSLFLYCRFLENSYFWYYFIIPFMIILVGTHSELCRRKDSPWPDKIRIPVTQNRLSYELTIPFTGVGSGPSPTAILGFGDCKI